MHTRQNQKNLTGAQKKRFVAALLELKRNGTYDEFVRVHDRWFVPDRETKLRVGHMSPSFFPWHRRYLLEFENRLRALDPGLSIPYWDWTTDNSPVSSLWADDFLGGTGREGDRRVTTGAFAYDRGNWTINVRTSEAGYLTRNLGRPQNPIKLPTAAELQWALDAPLYDSDPWDSTAPDGFRNRLEGWAAPRSEKWRNHNKVHQWIGGHMTGGAAPNDPAFWLHHAFVDLLWDRWQQRHPGAGYLPDRPLPLGDLQRGRVISLDEPMPPWDVTPREMLSHQGLYRYEA
ncbi:tyrosinase family protein [Streptomyces antimicrobicus]|uniref:Tyrosinase family protein n=1 Tax=Streptomyces antimicrobicus TaxID=2883108 RepID=A0ABS8B757_9ACTN|nr:tyrosinase family protein [Streptomyces antimicrobicus]MCB5180453.1 tyrosinase family protein [Streptomyces antimicrobicus]